MEGNNNHGYLQEDLSYDDLINGTGWPPSTEQYAYQQPHPVQGSYATPYPSHPSFDQFDLHQQAYPSTAYTNSPYTTHPQFQHARPSDVFAPTSFNLDPALQNPGAYPVDGSFSSGLHVDNGTISPQYLQYQVASNQPPVNRGASNVAYQGPASDYSQPQEPMFFNHTQNGNVQKTENSIRYPALPSASQNPESKLPAKKVEGPGDFSRVAPPSQPQVQVSAAQDALRTTHPQLHANNPSSRPRFQYAPFLSWEDTPIQVAPGLKSKC